MEESISRKSEDKVVELLARKLDVKFKNEPFPHQEWGKPDKWAQLSPNKYLLLEVEERQAHPDTNVLKVWPYLRENRKAQIFLIQAFFPKRDNRNISRKLLSEWTGHELEKRFPKRFRYCKINISDDKKKIDKSKLRHYSYLHKEVDDE